MDSSNANCVTLDRLVSKRCKAIMTDTSRGVRNMNERLSVRSSILLKWPKTRLDCKFNDDMNVSDAIEMNVSDAIRGNVRVEEKIKVVRRKRIWQESRTCSADSRLDGDGSAKIRCGFVVPLRQSNNTRQLRKILPEQSHIGTIRVSV